MPVRAEVELDRPLLPHEVLLMVDTRNFDVAMYPGRNGCRTRPASDAMVKGFLRDYAAVGYQKKLDMLMGRVLNWPAVLTAVFTAMKEPGLWRHVSTLPA